MQIAPFKIRIYAFLIDYIVIVLYGIFVVGTISFIFRPYIAPLFSISPVTAEITGFLMMTLPVSIYFIVCESSSWQGTIGKRKMKIRVVNKTGNRIGIFQSIIRTGIKFLPWEIAHFCIWRLVLPSNLSEMTIYIILSSVYLAILLFLIIPFTNKDKKNIYDYIANTKVIWNKQEKTK